MKTILVTGAAGFIGANLVLRMLRANKQVCIIGIDNMNDYYDDKLKEIVRPNIPKSFDNLDNTFFH